MHNHDDIPVTFSPRTAKGCPICFHMDPHDLNEIRTYLFKTGEEDTAQGQ